MKWLNVGKTIVSFGQGPTQYVLIVEAESRRPVRCFETLHELAVAIRLTQRSPVDDEVRFIKNDLPSIIWKPDDTVADRFLECERLSRDEVRELARLLR